MPLDRTAVGRYLRERQFEDLFIEELGWDAASTPPLDVQVDSRFYMLHPIAQKRGVIALALRQSVIPSYALRRKLETQVARRYREHVIIFMDDPGDQQVWQWVRREQGQPLQSREHVYHRGQSGEALIQKLEHIHFSLDQEDDLTLVEVVGQVRAAFNVERATKRFFQEFKKERDAFQKFLQGIPDGDLESWYVSVMLNRLMFIYFIQKKGFLDSDPDYLRNKLHASEQQGPDRYYSDLLCPLFFEGFAKPDRLRSPALRQRLGRVPYLNGGIFQRHQVEQRHGQAIHIPDRAFRRLFDFFDRYQWHLDDRPLRRDNEINPDVLGYIFEQYINQKEMGAYYTKEDITEYIGKNTIIPFLFDRARQLYPAAFKAGGAIWRLLQEEPDRYIYGAVRKGVNLPLPPEIEAGIHDVSQRGPWNTPASEAYALPTEIWRETVARRQRYEEIRSKLAGGEVQHIDDLITLNLDIRQFIQDVIERTDDPDLVRTFWKAVTSVTVLDPTCGSGAFLFAALNILMPIYAACLERMAQFIAELPTAAPAQTYRDFRETLADIDRHPNREYFILKRIMVDNLYGVDIMEEAVEIAKLRLFLKLVAQVEQVDQLEPLPDVDFNIRAGNTLVGFTSLEQVEAVVRGGRLLLLPEDEVLLAEIQEEAGHVDRLFTRFRQMQTAHDVREWSEDFVDTKAELRRRLGVLEDRLNRLLALQYGKADQYDAWVKSHQPFHWFVEFYGIMGRGGFDATIGNPPYVRYSDVREYRIRNYQTETCGDLYAYVLERSYTLAADGAFVGFIVPISIFGVDGFQPLQQLGLSNLGDMWAACFSNRPSQLFQGAQKRLTILIGRRDSNGSSGVHTSSYIRWKRDERNSLFAARITYAVRDDFYHVFPASLEKLGSALEISAFRKLTGNRQAVAQSVRTSGECAYYTRKFGYFLAFLNFIPEMQEVQSGKHTLPTELKSICFRSANDVLLAIAVFTSSTFFWFWNTLSDCRNLNRRDLLAFPLELAKVDPETSELLRNTAAEYLAKLRETTRYMTKSGLRIQTFDYSSCKPIIDMFDIQLRDIFGFTDEELDYIISYDIKYRMGDELFADEDEDEG